MTFLPGLELSERFYHEAVRPILQAHFPGLSHSAALIGYGSDVIGMDTAISTDHMWGPRLYLFLSEEDHPAYQGPVMETLRQRLPVSFAGFSTHFGAVQPDGVRLPEPRAAGPVDPLIWIETVPGYFQDYLGWDPGGELTDLDWLIFPEHRLLSLTTGKVFWDGLNALNPARERLAWYPHSLWLYLMACEWKKINEEEPFVGRTGDVGDDPGSRLIASRLVHSLMRLAFFMERRYPPYSKWFGSAFARLESAPRLAPLLDAALKAPTWQEREAALAQAYTLAAEMHNRLGVTPPQSAEISTFYSRPYRVIHAGRFTEALLAAIPDETIRSLPLIGSINQWSESGDLLTHAQRQALKKVWTVK